MENSFRKFPAQSLAFAVFRAYYGPGPFGTTFYESPKKFPRGNLINSGAPVGLEVRSISRARSRSFTRSGEAKNTRNYASRWPNLRNRAYVARTRSRMATGLGWAQKWRSLSYFAEKSQRFTRCYPGFRKINKFKKFYFGAVRPPKSQKKCKGKLTFTLNLPPFEYFCQL